MWKKVEGIEFTVRGEILMAFKQPGLVGVLGGGSRRDWTRLPLGLASSPNHDSIKFYSVVWSGTWCTQQFLGF